MDVTVLFNAGARAGRRDRALPDRIADAFHRHGWLADVHRLDGARVAQAAKSLGGGAGLLVAAGGDGTVSAVAGAVAGSHATLGVLPLGTLNHFAKDAGVPLALEDAVRAIVQGETRRVDVAEVNGRVFVNNSSLGLYPWAVERREALWREGRPKWMAMLAASVQALRRMPLVRAFITAQGEREELRTPVLFVGNNTYRMSVFAPGVRERIDRGELCIYAPRATSRAGFLLLVARALLGRARDDPDFVVRCMPELSVDSQRRPPLVSVDGEIVRMSWPLEYRVRPRNLRVRLPARTR